MDAIRTEALSKHYSVGFWRPRPYVALDRLTLSVGAGEIFGFLGPNGSGKTTTLKLLMQLIFPTSGVAEILGRPAGDVDVRRRIGYLPENPFFYDNVSAEELLGYFASLFGYHGAERTARVSRLLDEVGLGAERRFQLRKYSKGMIQRVGLAQALLNEPEVVFLDEPMSGLDPIGRHEVRDILLRLRDRGTTVFFSSHILADAEAVCTSVGIIDGGRLVASGRVADLVSTESRGWELVVEGLTDALAAQLVASGSTVTRHGHRHSIALAPGVAPEATLERVRAAGATLVSLAALRETLEDVFLQRVQPSATSAGRLAATREGR